MIFAGDIHLYFPVSDFPPQVLLDISCLLRSHVSHVLDGTGYLNVGKPMLSCIYTVFGTGADWFQLPLFFLSFLHFDNFFFHPLHIYTVGLIIFAKHVTVQDKIS